jgi:hypothetical protein
VASRIESRLSRRNSGKNIFDALDIQRCGEPDPGDFAFKRRLATQSTRGSDLETVIFQAGGTRH